MTKKRKAHVKRIFLTDQDGNLNTDISVDMLRLEEIPIVLNGKADGTEGVLTKYKLKWNDDQNNPDSRVDDSNADKQYENANGRRKTKKLKIKNPDSPDDDPLELWIIEKAYLKMPQGDPDGIEGQVVNFKFNNTPTKGDPDDDTRNPVKRKVTVIKVVNNDLNGLDLKNDDDSSQIVDWEDYKKALQDGTKDDSQYLDVEVPDKFGVKFGVTKDSESGQKINYVVKGNKQFSPSADSPLFDAGNPDAVDTNGKPSVIRTDPLQLIVNVNLGGLAVDFGDKAMDAPDPPKKSSSAQRRLVSAK